MSRDFKGEDGGGVILVILGCGLKDYGSDKKISRRFKVARVRIQQLGCLALYLARETRHAPTTSAATTTIVGQGAIITKHSWIHKTITP
jgi:hypothetical protein